MSHRVLVVDDEKSIRALLATHLEDLGYHVLTAGDSTSGVSAFDDHQPDLVLVDVLLPRGNGFTVAEAVRRHVQGAQTPIIMMSGVFKSPKTAVEARQKYKVLDFLSKPIDLVHLGRLVRRALEEGQGEHEQVSAFVAAPAAGSVDRPAPRRSRGLPYIAAVDGPPHGAGPSAPTPLTRVSPDLVREGVFVGRPFPKAPPRGELAEFPVALLLSSLRFDQATGMLDLSDCGTHRRIYLVDGNPIFMQSNAEGENVAALLLRRGRITEPDFDRCIHYMKNERRTLQRALLDLHMVSETDLATAYKLLAGQLLPVVLGMASGDFAWRQTDAFVGRVPEGRFEQSSLLFDGIKRHVHPPQILRFFRGSEDVALLRTLQFEPLMPLFRRVFSADNVAGKIDGIHSYRSITQQHPDREAKYVPQLFALVTSGMAVLPLRDTGERMTVQALSGDLEFSIDVVPEDEGDAPSGDLQAQAAVDRFHQEIMGQDFFQIFDVSPEDDIEVVKAKYFELAGRWHEDAFLDRNLGRAREKLDEIFGRVNEAYETITDRSKREDYMCYLDRRARGLPTDVHEIRRAEQLFKQAVAMVERADWDGARPVLEEASKYNPDPLYLATLGWVIFKLSPSHHGDVSDAVRLLMRAVDEQEDLPAAYQYLGQIAFEGGQTNEARRWWRRCLEWDPNNAGAVHGLRRACGRADTVTDPRPVLEQTVDNE